MKKNVLHIELNQDGTIGGSYFSLLTTIRCLHNSEYLSQVMFYQNNALSEKFKCFGIFPIIWKKPTAICLKPQKSVLRVPLLIYQKLYNFFLTIILPLLNSIIFLHKNPIDLVHLNNTATAGFEWLIAAKILGKKCITHQRGFAEASWFNQILAKRFDTIICISESIRNSLEDLGITSNLKMLYNCIDVEEFNNTIKKDAQEIRNEFGIDHNEHLIGIVGNFQAWKGQITVIKAVNIVKKTFPNLKCLLIGDVSMVSENDRNYFESVKREVQANYLEDNVIFTGYRTDVADIVNSLDLLIHSSIRPEPFGRVIIEGMSLRRPIIATNMGGPMEIIQNGISGLLIPPADPYELANAIEYLIKNPEERKKFGENAFQRVLKIFSFEEYGISLKKIYHEVLSEN